MVTQSEYWNGPAGEKWASLASNQDSLLGELGEAAMDAAGISTGQSVLDIGCGSGGSTFEISRRIGASGTVWGVDISGPMLGIAADRLESHQIENVKFSEADVTTFDFNDHYFDIAFSRFGVMFFEDPYEAFKNINKALKKGGQLSFVCWQQASLNPWQSLSIEVIRGFLDLPAPPPKGPGPFAFEDKSYVQDILESSNFQEIEIMGNEEQIIMFSGKSLKEACEDYLTINPIVTEMLKNSANELKEEILEALMTKFSDFHKEEGLVFPSATWIVTAKK